MEPTVECLLLLVERLKIQCVRAMSDLQSLQSQHANALKRCEEVAKETDFYQ